MKEYKDSIEGTLTQLELICESVDVEKLSERDNKIFLSVKASRDILIDCRNAIEDEHYVMKERFDKVKTDERTEFVGQIMDVIDRVLADNDMSFPNNKQLMLESGMTEEEADENDVVLFGENYDMFADPITEVLQKWNVLETE